MARLLGYLFAALALVALGVDIWRGPLQEAELAFASTAEHWRDYDANSLVGFGAYVEQNVSPELWDLAILPALSWPAFVLAGLIAALLFLVAGRSRRRKPDGLVFPRNRR